jgi:hypothetical protein
VQPNLDAPSRPRPKVTPIWRRTNGHRAILARQTIEPTSERSIRQANHVPPSRHLFFPGKRGTYEGVGLPDWSVMAFHVPHRLDSTEHEEPSTQTPTTRTSVPISRHVRTTADNDHSAVPLKYRLIEPSAHAPWHALMRSHVGVLVGTDDLSDLVLELLTLSLAHTTYNNYNTGMGRFTVFATKRASPRYMLPRPTCFALQHGSPEQELSRSLPTLLLSGQQFFPRPAEGAGGAGTTSNGRTLRTRHAATIHDRPRHSRTNPNTHRTSNATIRPPTLPRVHVAAGHPCAHQDFRAGLADALTIVIFAARKPEYTATWKTSRSIGLAVTNFYSYERQREINVGPRPTRRYYNS